MSDPETTSSAAPLPNHGGTAGSHDAPAAPRTAGPFRFSIFTKIVGGLLLVILFMVLASVQILMQMERTSITDQPELAIVGLTHELIEWVDREQAMAEKYFEHRDRYDEQTSRVIARRFATLLDSLNGIVQNIPLVVRERDSLIALLDGISSGYRHYDGAVTFQIARVKSDPRSITEDVIDSLLILKADLQRDLRRIPVSMLPLLARAIRKIDQKFTQPLSTAYWILGLAFCVALVSGLLVARTVTRPIQSLKAGTEKVGEGAYETVPITTSDEIADLTRAFNLMSDKLRQLDEMRMQMMSEISHEMRTPLQVIKAGCYSIIHAKDGSPLTQRQRDAVAMIHQATNRINQFVNSFLDIAKMEAGLMTYGFEDANLIDVITPLVQEAQLIAQTRQIRVDFQSSDVPAIRLDRERISQVFSNLLSNALKYTPDGGTISVRIACQAECSGTDASANSRGCVRVDVHDTGVGIPAADLSKLFSKFFQAKNVPLVNEKGSGLGLALVKHVAEAHGGRVSVESEVGAGSTFSVQLPINE